MQADAMNIEEDGPRPTCPLPDEVTRDHGRVKQ